MREQQERIHGPYKHRNRWRYVLVRVDGRKETIPCESATREGAKAEVAVARGQAQGRTIVAAVDAFEVSQRERGLASATIRRTREHLDKLLQLERHGSKELRWLTPARAAAAYEARQIKKSVDTHRNSLAAGKAFGRWCVKRGWLAASPFADVEPVGRRNHGKPQLHLTEATSLIDVCLAEKSRESAAVMLALLLGLRASEVAHRQVRDLDNSGRLLWVPKGKTPNARRCLDVPDVVRPLLLELAGDRAGAAWLFGKEDLARPSRHWVLYHVRRLCDVAKVPVVCAHGLRGTHTSLAVAAGATSQVVASALGHASTSITEAAYLDAQTRARAVQHAALRKLTGGQR